MSFKNTLFMALVLALVGLFIFRYEIPEGERIERESFVLRKADESGIRRIAVSGVTGNYVFVRDEKESPKDKSTTLSWKLEGLPDAVLEAGAVNILTDGLQKFKSDSVIPAAEVAADLSVYGLNAPPLTVEVGEGDTKTIITFGKKNDFIDKRYARITAGSGRSEIVLTDDSVFQAASKSREDFREKNPIQFTDASIASVTGDWKGGHYVLEQGASEWRLKEPLEAGAETDAVLTIVRELRGLKVDGFIDNVQDLAAYQLASPEMTFKIAFKDGQRNPLVVALSKAPSGGDGKTEYSYVHLGGSTVYKIASNPLPKLQVSSSFYRARRLFAFDVDSAQKLVVTRSGTAAGDEKTVLEAQGAQWKVNGSDGDVVFILQYLNDISFLEATDFPGSGELQFGFEKPAVSFEVTLKDSEGKSKERTLIVGNSTKIPSGGEGYFAADRDHLNLPFIIADSALQKLLPKVEALKKIEGTPKAL